MDGQETNANQTSLALLLAFATCLVGFLVFSPALFNEFAFDDLTHITSNPDIKRSIFSLDTWLDVFSKPTWPGYLYRPLPTLSYIATYSIAGLEPSLFHATNVLLHVLVSFLVFLLLKEIVLAEIAAVASMLFLVHPLHVEVVASVVYRTELLSAFFGLIAILSALYRTKTKNENKRAICLFILCFGFFFALLSKESAACIILLIPLCLFFQKKPKSNHQKYFFPLLVCLFVFCGYLLLRHQATGYLLQTGYAPKLLDNPLTILPVEKRAISGFALLGRYLKMSILPLELRADYSLDQIPLWTQSSGWVWQSHLGLALFAAVAALAAGLHGLVTGFWLIWFFASFAVTSNILFPIGTIFGERLAYLPSIGICGMLARALFVIPKKRIFWMSAVFVVGVFSIHTARNITYWKNQEALFTKEINLSPFSAKVQYNYGVVLFHQQLHEQARIHLIRALDIFPGYFDAAHVLGVTYLLESKETQAEHWLEKAIQINPDYTPSLSALGRLYATQGNSTKAAVLADKILAANPAHFEARVIKLVILAKKEEKDEAIKLLHILELEQPAHPDVVYFKTLLSKGD